LPLFAEAVQLAHDPPACPLVPAASDRLRSRERNAARRLAGPEALTRRTRSLINRAEESSLKRVERSFGGEEAEAAVFVNNDARRSVADLNDVG